MVTEIVNHLNTKPESSHVARHGRTFTSPSCSQAFLFGAIMTKEYYQKHKAEIDEYQKQYQKQYYRNNKEKIDAIHAEYNKEHKAELVEYQRRRYQERKAEIAQCYQDNKESISERKKQHYQDNKKMYIVKSRVYRQSEEGRKKRSILNQKRRALKFGAEYETFSRQEIFQRDKYVCQLCNRKTRPDYNQYHPLYPHLDHIVPLSLGGYHTKVNTQCLCRNCNTVKKNIGLGDQLRLFG